MKFSNISVDYENLWSSKKVNDRRIFGNNLIISGILIVVKFVNPLIDRSYLFFSDCSTRSSTLSMFSLSPGKIIS